MKAEFIPVAGECVARTLPLAQILVHDLTLQRWQDYVEAVSARTAARGGWSGVAALRMPDGCFRALFAFWPGHDLCHGRMLIVENVILASLTRSRWLAEQTLRTIEELSEAQNCPVVHIALATPMMWLSSHVQDRGFVDQGSVWVRRPMARELVGIL